MSWGERIKKLQSVGKDTRLGTMAHACHTSYSGGSDQEDLGSKPSWTNSSTDPILKKTHHKKGLVE
jgi:hypothetical protein